MKNVFKLFLMGFLFWGFISCSEDEDCFTLATTTTYTAIQAEIGSDTPTDEQCVRLRAAATAYYDSSCRSNFSNADNQTALNNDLAFWGCN